MKTKISSQHLDAKKGYNAPKLHSADIELEQGIAATSAGVETQSIQQQWGDRDIQSQGVESPWD